MHPSRPATWHTSTPATLHASTPDNPAPRQPCHLNTPATPEAWQPCNPAPPQPSTPTGPLWPSLLGAGWRGVSPWPHLYHPHVEPRLGGELLPHVPGGLGGVFVGVLQRLQLLGRDGGPGPLSARLRVVCKQRSRYQRRPRQREQPRTASPCRWGKAPQKLAAPEPVATPFAGMTSVT